MDELDFAEQLRNVGDSELLNIYSRLAKQRIITALGESFQDDAMVSKELYESYSEIDRRIKKNQWNPVKPRVKRTWR